MSICTSSLYRFPLRKHDPESLTISVGDMLIDVREKQPIKHTIKKSEHYQNEFSTLHKKTKKYIRPQGFISRPLRPWSGKPKENMTMYDAHVKGYSARINTIQTDENHTFVNHNDISLHRYSSHTFKKQQSGMIFAERMTRPATPRSRPPLRKNPISFRRPQTSRPSTKRTTPKVNPNQQQQQPIQPAPSSDTPPIPTKRVYYDVARRRQKRLLRKERERELERLHERIAPSLFASDDRWHKEFNTNLEHIFSDLKDDLRRS